MACRGGGREGLDLNGMVKKDLEPECYIFLMYTINFVVFFLYLLFEYIP